MKRLRLIVVLGLGAVLTALGAAIAPALAGDGPLPPDVQEVRKAVARYHSFQQAANDGYSVEGEPCVSSPLGTMGIHAVNEALLADPAIDPLRPELLLYVPKDNGQLEFVGVEYWKIALANTASGPMPWFGAAEPPLGFFTPAPALFGQTFDGPMEGHNPTMPWHYDLHVWVAEANPSGVFAMFNPATSC
jgi:hypothetical protein